LLEPGQPVGEHALVGQPLPHPGLDRAQVLADDQRPGGRALQGQDAQQVVGRVADVGALGRLGPLGDPEQPEQPHHVVDAQAGGVGHAGPDGLGERPVAAGGHPVGDERRQAPVLAVRAQRVGRGADRDAGGQLVLERPGVEAVGGEADGQVVEHPQPAGVDGTAASCSSSSHWSQAW
jgi:hypothetical protein